MTAQFHYGDIVWMDFKPSAGHEQNKRRPAVVISNDDYNRYNNLVMVIPITSTQSEYPLHINIGTIPTETTNGKNLRQHITGWAEIEQIKSLDLQARNARYVAAMDTQPLTSITDMVLGCLMQPDMTMRRLA